MNEKAKLLHDIQALDFTLVELNLYLDTHPTCPNGLRRFSMTQAQRDRAVAEYVSKFGPLTAAQAADDSCWTWVKGPWPWERSEC